MRFCGVFALAVTLASGLGFGQDIKTQGEGGSCEMGYFPFEEVCINAQAIRERGSEAIIQELVEFRAKNPGAGSVRRTLCVSKINRDEDNILWLENGAVVQVERGYLGFVGSRRDVLLYKSPGRCKLWIEGKRVFDVDLIREPAACRSPSRFLIEAAAKDEVFVINGEVFKAQTFCLGWTKGESVVFAEGNAMGTCASATLFNIDRQEACEVWCE